MWVAATLHPDHERGFSALSLFTPHTTWRNVCTTALDAGSCLGVIVEREAALRFRTRHGASSSMTTAHEAFRIALAAHDVRTRTHAAGDDSHVAFTRTHGALTRDEHVLPVVVLPGHIVVMAAHDFHIGFQRRDF